MRPHVQIQLTAGTICAMTDEQFHALRDNVLAGGLWENVDGPLRIDGGDYLGVFLPGIFVGIEKDGYTHS
jgi:hypothetical protein